MRRIADRSVNFVLTDPPYLCNYRSREGESIRNDHKDSWIYPAFRHIHRVMKPDSFCVSFYGWHKADEEFIAAWRRAGFRLAGHIVFQKQYASSSRFLQATHEQAYLLAKGEPAMPENPIPDVLDWQYTGNKLTPDTEAGRQPETPHRRVMPRGRPGVLARSAAPVQHWSQRGKPAGHLSKSGWTGGIGAPLCRRLKTIRRKSDFAEGREAA